MAITEFRDAAALDTALERWVHCEESLLTEMALTKHGYSARLAFNLTWAAEGVLRPDLDQREHLLLIELHGIQRLSLTGALTPTMLSHPEAIDWGLSEVAQVRAQTCEVGLQLDVHWESARRLVIEAQSAEVMEPQPPSAST